MSNIICDLDDLLSEKFTNKESRVFDVLDALEVSDIIDYFKRNNSKIYFELKDYAREEYDFIDEDEIKEKDLSDFTEDELLEHLEYTGANIFIPENLMEDQLQQAFNKAMEEVRWPQLLNLLNQRS